MIILYDKETLTIRGRATKDTISEEIELNVVPNFGGTESDYGYLESDLSMRDIDIQLVNGKPAVVDISVINQLMPSDEQIEKAERQVNLINDLIELGVI